MSKLSLSKKSIQIIKSITNSTYLDFIGLIIVITASIALGYHNTEYKFTFQGKNYVFFLGYVSIVNTGLSMIGNRLVTKKNNIGNFLATCNTFLSGSIDYLLGNVGAILTYPVSFVANYLVFNTWKKNRVLRSVDFIFYRNIVLGFFFSLVLNYIAFKYLSEKEIDWKLFFAIAIPAGITFGGTFNTARMYPDNWFMWQFYNITKLIQNLLMMNIANVAKYSFYFFNAIIGYITWNDDRKKALK
ncbi:MAG: nicotinamide mononucleotide transporter family protein [Flavobacterium sp.]|uniref:nicotinamide mononucleotide transporter family protein n=1 Tax=Flavobacterium sp. TaxID=239 RepID=UPI0022C6B4D4|nr:nicotinamide mononucleotide transporter family protein [Flavobacterium sp.]MCZ8197727.1 nicotinamide mononucleotide transporter family protein [Flavobacterium sp.]